MAFKLRAAGVFCAQRPTPPHHTLQVLPGLPTPSFTVSFTLGLTKPAAAEEQGHSPGTGCSPARPHSSWSHCHTPLSPKPPAQLLADPALSTDCHCWPLHLPVTVLGYPYSPAGQQPQADLKEIPQLLPASPTAWMRCSAQTACQANPSRIPLWQRQRSWTHRQNCSTPSSF